MKKIIALLLAIIIAMASLPTMAFADGEAVFANVSEITDSKEYVIVWHVTDRGETSSYALSSNASAGFDKKITDNVKGNAVYLDEANNSDIIWTAKKSGKFWQFESKATGEYLFYDEELDTGLALSTDPSDRYTIWEHEVSYFGNLFVPYYDGSVQIRYSASGGRIETGEDETNAYLLIYEKGAKVCEEHEYTSCLDSSCNKCGVIAKTQSELGHEYANDASATCIKCGFERTIYSTDTPDGKKNTAIKSVSGIFVESNKESELLDSCEAYFDITGLIGSIAPIENVKTMTITVEASDITWIEGAEEAPKMRFLFNGKYGTQLGEEFFTDSNVVSFKTDFVMPIDPEEEDEIEPEDLIIDSVYLIPEDFIGETEISFKITASVTYRPYEETVYGEPSATIITFSDYQYGGSNVAGNNGDVLLMHMGNMLDTMGNVTPDYVFFGGDYGSTVSAEGSTYSRNEQTRFLANRWNHITLENGTYIPVQGNHDPDGTEGLLETGPIEYEDFIAYVLNEDEMPAGMHSDSNKALCEKTAADMTAYFDGLIAAGDTRPVFILSHTCLHYDIGRVEGNNRFAYIIFDAINKAAEKLDIIFMFGHNHSTGDIEVGGSVVYKPVGDSLFVSNEDCYLEDGAGIKTSLGLGKETELNFTYMTYGYVGYVGDHRSFVEDPSVDEVEAETILAMSKLQIYDDIISVDVYSMGGKVSEYCRVIERKNSPASPKNPSNATVVKHSSGVEPMTLIIAAGAVLVIAVVVIIILIPKKKAKKQ